MDITAVVPTQRIVTEEVAARNVEAGPGPATPAAPADPEGAAAVDLNGVAAVDLSGVAAGLPDLSAVLATVPGGLGAEMVEAFTYAGQRWTAADAKVNGTPIGLQLAMEQRGLDTSTDFDVPLQRAAGS